MPVLAPDSPPLRFWTIQAWALTVWFVVAFAVAGRSALATHPRHAGIYPVYAKAGDDWAAGRTVYPAADGFDIFRYAPVFAAGFVPLSVLPLELGSLVWRVCSCGLVLYAAAVWVRSNPAGFAPGSRARSAFLILLAPLVTWDLVAGQTNAVIAALILLAATDAGRGRWWRAAAWLVPACLLKLFPVAFALLLVAAHPRQLWWRFPVALAVGLVSPFLLQHPTYVAQQYPAWVRTVLADDGRQGWAVGLSYRDVRWLVRVWGGEIPAKAFLAAQLVGAALAAAACLVGTAADRRWRAVGLGAVWMTVLGPATEGVTYALLGPALAWSAHAVSRHNPGWVVRGLTWGGYYLLASGFMAYVFPFGVAYNSLGVQPAGGLLFALGFVGHEFVRCEVAAQVRRRISATRRVFALTLRSGGKVT